MPWLTETDSTSAREGTSAHLLTDGMTDALTEIMTDGTEDD